MCYFNGKTPLQRCFAAKPVSPQGLQFVELFQKFSDEGPFNAPHGILKPRVKQITK